MESVHGSNQEEICGGPNACSPFVCTLSATAASLRGFGCFRCPLPVARMGYALRSLRGAGALLALAAALCAIAAGALGWTLYRQALSLDRAEVQAAAQLLAFTVTADSAPNVLARTVDRGFAAAVLIEESGRVAAGFTMPALANVRWPEVTTTPEGQPRDLAGSRYWMAAVPTPRGATVVVARAAERPSLGPALAAIGGVAFAAWLLLWFAIARVGGHRRASTVELSALLERLVATRPDASQRHDAVKAHGEDILPLLDLAERLADVRAESEEARALVRAFLQVGSHYTVLCDLDGRVLDANPAFLARTGLGRQRLRVSQARPLGCLLPLHSFVELARRSLEENTTISGITWPLTLAGEERVVEVSIRAIPAPAGTVVFLALSDVTHARRLERQIDQFTDTIDLMVDQRVAQITAGRTTIENALEDAGLSVIVFDGEGAVLRMNRGAEDVLGQAAFRVTRLGHVAAALCPDPALGNSFRDWCCGGGSALATFLVPASGEKPDMLWAVGRDCHGGAVVQRTLVGMKAGDRAADESMSSVRRIETLAARLDASEFQPEVRVYVEVIREAARRLDCAEGGDGAAPAATARPSNRAL
jgi:PAS domain S-box-containing protein